MSRDGLSVDLASLIKAVAVESSCTQPRHEEERIKAEHHVTDALFNLLRPNCEGDYAVRAARLVAANILAVRLAAAPSTFLACL